MPIITDDDKSGVGNHGEGQSTMSCCCGSGANPLTFNLSIMELLGEISKKEKRKKDYFQNG